jgi:hypothetical protein
MMLDSLIEQAETKFPAVRYKDGRGSRAQAAAELVRLQRVEFMGDQGNRDYWRVDGHVCSLKGGCDCVDGGAPIDPNGRKLCKHRLAVMFVRKMQDDHGLVAIMRGVKGDRLALTVQVLYADNGRQYTINAYRSDGVETVFPYEERLRFTESEFSAALRICGWGLPDRPVRLPGMNYRYILIRGAESVYTAAAMTAQDSDKRASNERMKEIALAAEMDAEIAAELAAEAA